MVEIDIAKVKDDIVIERLGRKRRQRLRILYTGTGQRRLVKHLKGLDCLVRIGCEATANYHRPLAWRLRDEGFELRLISSMALANDFVTAGAVI